MPDGPEVTSVHPRVRRLLASVLAVGLLAAVLAAVGPTAVARELRGADPAPLALLPVAGLAALAAWAEAQRQLHRAAGAAVGPGRFWPAYAVAALAKLGVPGGSAGGPALTAAAVGRETDLALERDLAAASLGSVLGVAGAVTPAVVGAAAVGLDGLLLPVVAVAAVLIGAAGVVRAWPALARRSLDLVAAGLARGLGRVPGVADATRRRVADAPTRVAGTVGTVAGDRTAVGLALALSTLGWCLSAAALVAAGAAVGHAVPIAAALAVVPVASVARLVPVPAGLGGVEAALSALLVTTGVPAAGAVAVALLHRAGTDLVVAVAGAIAAGLGR